MKNLGDSHPHVFFDENATITSEFTGKNWGARDQNLINRKTRIKLEPVVKELEYKGDK